VSAEIAEFRGLPELEQLLSELSDRKYYITRLEDASFILDEDARTRYEEISQTPLKSNTQGRKKLFAVDTGRLRDSWLKGLRREDFKAVRSTDVEYAERMQELIMSRSKFEDGLLGYSDKAIEGVLNEIGDAIEKLWKK